MKKIGKIINLLLLVHIHYALSDDCTPELFMSDPEACGNYFICDNGVFKNMACPFGLYWNNILNVCDWPQNVNCETKHHSICVDGGECSHGEYYPNTENCHSFFHCVRGKLILTPCPAELFWNDQLHICDWPETSGCVEAVTESVGNDPTSENNYGSESTTAEDIQVEKTTLPGELHTPADPNTTFVDQTTTDFLMSTEQSTIEVETTAAWEQTTLKEEERTTPEDQNTTPDEQSTPEVETTFVWEQTTLPEEVRTTPEDQNITPDEQSTPEVETTSVWEQTARPEEVRTTPEGQQTTADEQSTPEVKTTSVWEQTTLPEEVRTTPEDQKTTPSEQSTPEVETTSVWEQTSLPEEEGTTLEDQKTTPDEQSTPEVKTTSVWEETTLSEEERTPLEEQKTSPDEQSTPEVKSTAAMDQTPSPEGGTTTPKEFISTNPDEQSTPEVETTEVESSESDEDMCDIKDYLANLSDCTTFYKCDNGKLVLFSCAKGLHFNKDLNVCDWPQNANCQELNVSSGDISLKSQENSDSDSIENY